MDTTTNIPSGSAIRPFAEQTTLERVLRAHLWQPKNVLQRATESLPKHAKLKEYKEAGEFQERIRNAEDEIEQWEYLLELYEQERQSPNDPSSATAASDREPRYSKMELDQAVTACCTCGGGGPGERHTCPACEVYHTLVAISNDQAHRPGVGTAEAQPGSGAAPCSAIPSIQSAVLNIGTAMSDCESAREAWIEANWNDATMWISNAIEQLQSARSKIYRHQEVESPNDRTERRGTVASEPPKTL